MLAFYAYILRCSDRSYYTGHTEELEVRIAQHQRGTFPGYTHERRPVVLVWCQDFPERDEAKAAERRIKGWGRAKKEALIAGDWERLSELARNRQNREGPSTSSGPGPSTGSGPFDGLRADGEGRALPQPVRAEPVEAAGVEELSGALTTRPSTSSGQTDGEMAREGPNGPSTGSGQTANRQAPDGPSTGSAQTGGEMARQAPHGPSTGSGRTEGRALSQPVCAELVEAPALGEVPGAFATRPSTGSGQAGGGMVRQAPDGPSTGSAQTGGEMVRQAPRGPSTGSAQTGGEVPDAR